MSDDFITINSSDKFIRRIRSTCILIYMYMIYGRRVAIYSTIRDNETKTHYNLARRRTDSLRRNQLAICRRMSATRHSSPPQRLPPRVQSTSSTLPGTPPLPRHRTPTSPGVKRLPPFAKETSTAHAAFSRNISKPTRPRSRL